MINSDGKFPKIILNFSEPTNIPLLQDALALDNAIIFNHGKLKLESGYGYWSADDGGVLTITGIEPTSWTAITDSIASGDFHVMPRTRLLMGTANFSREQRDRLDGESLARRLQGNLSMRVSSADRLVTHLYSGYKRISTSPEIIDVAACPEIVTIPKWETSSDVRTAWQQRNLPVDSELPDGHQTWPSKPVFTVEGVLAMPGDAWLEASPVVTYILVMNRNR